MSSRNASLHIIFLFCLLIPNEPLAETFYVRDQGPGSDGHSWETAFSSIGTTLSECAPYDHIWVSEGVYRETIELVTGVQIYGGFSGNESELEFDLRDWKAHPTILDASYGGTACVGANEAVVDGLRITRGIGQGYSGGGISCADVVMVFRNCDIDGNSSGSSGFGNEYRYGAGGGVLVKDSDVEFHDCSISNNGAGAGASGFYGSTAEGEGGGVFATGRCNLLFSSTVFRGNRCDVMASASFYPFGGREKAGGAGFAGSLDGGAVRFENCLIVENVISTSALDVYMGAAGIDTNLTFSMNHCTVANNVVANRGAADFDNVRGAGRVTNSIFWSRRGEFGLPWDPIGRSGSNYGGEPGDDPLFVSDEYRAVSIFLGSSPGDYRLRPGSPCIDAATDTEISTDLDGLGREIDVVGVGDSSARQNDIGAFEFQLMGSDMDKNGFLDSRDLFLFQKEWQASQ
ncbi:MAG: hypothetical protein H6752_01515 [Candidatus Omnitrophica bacterium]|nr:hypothetical protein [Candidatus Omnitrophota bacterium]